MAWMNFEDFLNENPQLKITGMHGPPSPLKLTNDQPKITRKSPESKVKIPKPGPMNPPGKKTATTARKESRTLNSLSALGSNNIKNNQPAVMLNGKELTPTVKNYLDALSGNPAQAARELEVDMNFGTDPVTGQRRLFAFPPNELTDRRISPDFKPRSAILGDLPVELPFTPKPVTPEEKMRSKAIFNEFEERAKAVRDAAKAQVKAARDQEKAARQTYRSFLDEISQVGPDTGPGIEALQAEKRAGYLLEIMKDDPGMAEPPGPLTKVSVAEGISVRTGAPGYLGQGPGAFPPQSSPNYKPVGFSRHNRRDANGFLNQQINMKNIRVGKTVRDERFEASRAQKQEAARQAREAARANRRPVQEAVENTYTPSFVRRVQDANQASATISSSPMPGSSAASGATDTATRAGSRVADMLGEDTVRAASVIHSSKLNYAAVGLAGMAAVFGIASAGRQRKNMEQEIQSRF
jgi:hypothetical protein